MTVEFDAETGREPGEQRPPHGSQRFKMFDSDDKLVLKMQWIYEFEKLRLAADQWGIHAKRDNGK